jgi:hypothetical protein
MPINITFRAEDGMTLRTEHMTGGEVDIDLRPQYSKVPTGHYHEIGSLSNFSRMIGTDIPFATVISRRGCRAHCSFCGVRNFNGKSVRVRQVDGVVDEMVFLREQFGVRHFDWLDDDLLYDRDGAVRLFRQIAERLPDVSWASNNGLIAAAVTPEILEAMRDSHCVGYKIGLESGNPEVLRRIHKPTSLDKFFGFADLSQGYPEMFAAINFIMGFPGETFGQMRDSMKAALWGRCDWNNFYFYQHLKNTEMYLTHGAMNWSADDMSGGENQKHVINLNPVRGGGFREYKFDGEWLTAYDVIEHDPAHVPTREQLKEIWFTFNTVVNFLRMPALFTKQQARLDNAILWIEALQEAYPQDPMMPCLLAHLYLRRDGGDSSRRRAASDRAWKNLAPSDYWKARDCQFHFTAFLDGEIPPVDARFHRYLRPVE